MGAPQVILIALSTAGFFLAMQSHGTTVRRNFFIHCVSMTITYGLLIWGGFFN